MKFPLQTKCISGISTKDNSACRIKAKRAITLSKNLIALYFFGIQIMSSFCCYKGHLNGKKTLFTGFFRGENLFPLNNADNTPTASGMTRHTNRFFYCIFKFITSMAHCMISIFCSWRKEKRLKFLSESLIYCSFQNELAKFSGFHFLLTYFSENALTIDLIEESIFILQNFSISSGILW